MHIFFSKVCVKKIVIFQFIYMGARTFQMLCIFPKFIFVKEIHAYYFIYT